MTMSSQYVSDFRTRETSEVPADSGNFSNGNFGELRGDGKTTLKL
jgi:hypothetical protein